MAIKQQTTPHPSLEKTWLSCQVLFLSFLNPFEFRKPKTGCQASSKSLETWKWFIQTWETWKWLIKKSDLIQSLRDLKMTIQVLRDLKMTHQKSRPHPILERLENDLSKLERLQNDSSKRSDPSKSLETWKWLIKKIRPIQVLRDLKRLIKFAHLTLLMKNDFYVSGALVIASSLRRTEIKQVLSVRSLQTFLRLLGRFSASCTLK